MMDTFTMDTTTALDGMDTTGEFSAGFTGETPVGGRETEMACKMFTFIVYVGVFGPMAIFGLVGNTVSFIVLQWEKQNKVATFLLQVMAVIDNLFLVVVGITQIFSAVTIMFYEKIDHPAAPYMMVLVWPLVHITQMATVWVTVLIAMNRYIAICRPFQAPLWCSMSKARLQLIVMSIVIILYNIPRFFEFKFSHEFDPVTNTTQTIGRSTAMNDNEVYIILYQNILYCLFVFLGPLLILVFLNYSLCLELWRARQRLISRNLPVSGEEEEQNLTLVMIVIILIFLVCQTPAFLNQLLPLILGDAYVCGKPYFYYYHISNLLVSANSSLNFVVYCAFRKQFRARLWAFCGCTHSQSMRTCDSSYTGYTTYEANGNGKKKGAAHL